jgi:hypothetical protein
MGNEGIRSLEPARCAWVRIFPALLFAFLAVSTAPSTAVASFGIETFTLRAHGADGTLDERAASHPFALDVNLSLIRDAEGVAQGVVHTVRLDLPPGLVANVPTVPPCSPAEFDGFFPNCEGSSQIGILHGVAANLGQFTVPLYNVAPSYGDAAAFGASVAGSAFIQHLRLVGTGAASSGRLDAVLPADPAIAGIEEEIWGEPGDPAHDSERTCRREGELVEGCSSGTVRQPLLTLPATCSEPMRTVVTATSYGEPVATAVASALSRDAGGNPSPLSGCGAVPFEPNLAVRMEGEALAPSAFGIRLEVPQYEGPELIAAASLAELHLQLPAGLALNPAAGSGLTGCSAAAIGLESAAGETPPVFDEGAAECPGSSWLGSVRFVTPLIDHVLNGSIFLATPFANPFAARFALYLVIEDAATGTVLKIPGRLDADPGDGRLTATIPDLPQIPFENLDLEFAGGPRALLASPPSCGRYTTEATFSPSTGPLGMPVTRIASLSLSSGAEGKPCPSPESTRNPTPSFRAGTEVPAAGADSPLVVRLSREDTDQHLSSFELTLPPGLLANLGSVPLGASIGSVKAKVGVGPEPLAVAGTVYLEGPYRGAPYSLKAVIPAKVGPFDLGRIVELAAIDVDPGSAQIGVVADPLPQILAGIPLQVRELSIDLDHPGFIRNPTSCEPMAIAGSATTTLGQMAPLSDRFQVGACAGLPFKPKLSLWFAGAVGRNGHPALRAVLRSDPEDAAPASTAFSFPADELLDLRHLRGLCPRDVAVEQCPKSSRLGSLRIETPALAEPLEGSVYLRVPRHRLPDLSVQLHSGQIGFLLHGRTTDAKGRFGVSLGPIPDMPLSEAVLNLVGGRNGVIVNSRALCSRPSAAEAIVRAHNGKRRKLRLRPRVAGC